MIPDATLAEWEKDNHSVRMGGGRGGAGPSSTLEVVEHLAQAIAEIRRLRDEIEAWKTSQAIANVIAKKAEADLAAHQAVVRELADTLEAAQASLCASSDYQEVPSNRYALERIRAALADPLVQQAREEKV